MALSATWHVLAKFSPPPSAAVTVLFLGHVLQEEAVSFCPSLVQMAESGYSGQTGQNHKMVRTSEKRQVDSKGPRPCLWGWVTTTPAQSCHLPVTRTTLWSTLHFIPSTTGVSSSSTSVCERQQLLRTAIPPSPCRPFSGLSSPDNKDADSPEPAA